MSKDIISNVDNFLSRAIDSEDKLSKCCNDISNKESKLDRVLNDFDNYIKDNYSKESLDSKNKFKEEASKNIKTLASDIKGWNCEVENLKKGCEFITKFDDKMIIVVFGKVNSGKSSLGNLVMGNIFRTNLDTKYSMIKPPVVEVYDNGITTTQDKLEELESDKGFVEDSTEATSTIQLFKLGGMAWIDTPGIGSLTKENEDLAKEYVKNADLVIYITSSDAAGTQQDFKELNDLKGRKKPIVLAVSKSDTFEEDEDEHGEIISIRCPKSDSDRAEVEEYLKQELYKKELKDIFNHSQIITMSTALAKDAIVEKNDDKYKDSNIDRLYNTLADVMSNKAVEFKMANPKNRFNSLIGEIIGGKNENFKGIDEVKKNLENSKEIILETKNDLMSLESRVLSRIKTSSKVKLLDYISIKSAQIQEGSIKELRSEEISSYCNKIASEIYKDELVKSINKILDSFEYDFKRGLSININSDMKKMYDTITYEETIIDREEREPRGIRENIGGFFGKKYHKTTRTKVTRENKFELGTNESLVVEDVMNSVETSIKESIRIDLEEITKQYFDNIERSIDDINIKLEELKMKLLSEKYEDR